MAAPEYSNYITCLARVERFKASANATPALIEWAERRLAEAELLAAAERIVLEAAASRGLKR